MRLFIVTVCILALALSAGAADDRFVRVDRPTDLPSFVGWDNERIIVVLKSNVAVDHSRDIQSPKALSNYKDFAPLAKRFEVVSSRPQFPGSDRRPGGELLARHYKVVIGKGTVDEAMAAYKAHPMVDHVEAIGIHTLYATPNDPYYQDSPNPDFPYDQWHYYDTYGVDADLAWDTNPGDATVVVGVLDSGVRYYHRDLGGSDPPGPDDNVTNGNIFVNAGETPGDGIDNDGNGYVDDVIGWDFVERTDQYIGVECADDDCGTADNDPADCNGHGTHVAGTIAAITNNATLVAGVAGGFADGTSAGTANGVKLVPCRIGYHAKYRGQTVGVVVMDYVAEAMYYMGDLKANGTNVAAVNCSFGSSNSGGLGAAADYLLSQDVIIVVAAGNSGSSSPDYLGSRGDCLDVGATDKYGDPTSWSNYGSWVDVAAPGAEILSTFHYDADPANDYVAVMDGTSMSAPHVVGVAALLESCDPSLSATDKFNYIVSTSAPYNGTKDVGSGIANAKNAMDAAGCSGNNPPTANFSGTPISGDYPLTVSFTDLSSGSPTSWSWDFGDGVGTSTVQNPSYIYETAGTYTVSLTATNAYGSDTETKTDYITVTEPSTNPPVADFSGSPTSGDYPLTVSFTDLSTENPTSWSWDFGDGVGTSTEQNPSYTYEAAGTYTVSLTATNAYGSDTETKTDYITVTEPQVCAMHVHDIVVTRKNAGPNCNGIGTIYIYDASNQAVANATVYATATGPVSGDFSGITGTDGSVMFETRKTRSCSGEWCFEVTNVTHTSCTYDPNANNVTKACESGPVFKNEPTSNALPDQFVLNQNQPNPFNPATSISFSLPEASRVTLKVYNIRGQKVAELANGVYSAGQHTVEWDTSAMASGVYLYRLTASDFTETKKMILLK